jgi:3-phosphoshikimate 1-carboxyvinyltransferase
MKVTGGGPQIFETTVPSDKSITHRALILGAIAQGETVVVGALPSADCLATATILSQLGVNVNWQQDNSVRIQGGRLRESHTVLDCQNSGTTMRLLCGLLAGQSFYSVLTGDASLTRRPMDRIIEPLSAMGGEIFARDSNRYPPLTIIGQRLVGLSHFELPLASAQLKSALLLAGLFAKGKTAIQEPIPCRDHTERMLKDFGAQITVQGNVIEIQGGGELKARELQVPGDFSSAAFLIASALIVPGSEVKIYNVGLNPTRVGLLSVLERMGAKIQVRNKRTWAQEPVGDLYVEHSELSGTELGGPVVPSLIDEIPVLTVLATQASGTTVIRDAGELRVKESDRLRALTTELGRLGARIQELPDGLVIQGGRPLVGAKVNSYGDHRIAMALAVAAKAAEGITEIQDSRCVEISFPNFWQFFVNN